MPPSVNSFSVSCPPSIPHIQAYRTPKCLFIRRSTHPSASHTIVLIPLCSVPPSDSRPSISHVQVSIHSVSHAPQSLTHQCVSYFQVTRARASHMSKCRFIQCLMPFSASHIQVHIHSVPHTFKCLTHSSVSHIHVSHISKCLFIQCLTSRCLFIQCLTYPSVYSFSVSCP